MINFQVTRVVLLWVNNHFNDFEGDPAMTRFLEEFENNLEREVRVSIFSWQFRMAGSSQAVVIYNSLRFFSSRKWVDI